MPVWYILSTERINLSSIYLFLIAVLIFVLTSGNLVSLFYYLFGLLFLFQNIKLGRRVLEDILNIFIIICFAGVVLDYLSIDLVGFVTDYNRRLMIDERNFLHLPRPTFLYREPSEFALVLGTVYYVALKFGLKIRYYLLILTGSLLLSPTFIIIALVVYFLYSKWRYKYTMFTVILVLSFFLFYERLTLLLILGELELTDLASVDLSFVKRVVHPLLAVLDFLNTANIFEIFIGYGPGAYKDYLINKYYYLPFSDLHQGYLLNIMGNYLLGFGLLFLILTMYYLKLNKSSKEYFVLLLLLFQGIAVVHPVFFLYNLKIKE